MKKFIGLIIFTLLIITNVYPAFGYINIIKLPEIRHRETVDVWTNMSPSFVGGVLGPREFLVMAYDSGADRTILFGGQGSGQYSDTWAYDYSTNTWFNRNPSYSGGTLSFRSGSIAPGFAYDPDADRTILFGGNDGSTTFWNETWGYNYTNNIWVNRSPSVSGGSLKKQSGSRLAYYDSVDRMILFGGYDGDVLLNETWEYNYNTNTWTNLSPNIIGGSLPKTADHGLAYDSSADRIIYFGGYDESYNARNETWIYCYSNNTWWKRNPNFTGGTLDSRIMIHMVYDSNIHRTILFGGNHEWEGSYNRNDTWMYDYDDNTWYNVSYRMVNGNLYRREAMGLAYDSNNSKTIMACGWGEEGIPGVLNDTWVFTYNIEDNQAPNTPSLSGPTILNPEESGTYTTSASDPDGDQVQYQFDWDADGDHDYSSWTDWVSSGEEASLSHSWSDGGSYVVKARVRDFYGDISGWSTGLTVVVNSAPNSPSDPDPPDGEIDIDVNADLSWDCNDPEGDTITYDVYFEADDPTPDVLVSSNQSEKWYDPGTMEYETGYYWQIVAWDKYDASTEGSIWSFTTGKDPNNPPNTPFNPSPEDDATDVDVEDNLSWECDDPDGNNLTFDVYLDVVDPPEEKVSDDQNETTFDPGTLEFVTTYYWQVIAKDEHGASTPGSVWQFTTRSNNPPDVTTIDGPDKGNPGTTYEFGFTAIDPDADEIGEFIVKWGDDTGEETIIGPFDSGEEAFASHSWIEKGSYTIQAKAKDVYGAKCSAWGSFVISIPRTRTSTYYQLYERLFECFPLLERLLSFLLL